MSHLFTLIIVWKLLYFDFAVLLYLNGGPSPIHLHQPVPRLGRKLEVVDVFHQMIESLAHYSVSELCIIDLPWALIEAAIEETHPLVEPIFRDKVTLGRVDTVTEHIALPEKLGLACSSVTEGVPSILVFSHLLE